MPCADKRHLPVFALIFSVGAVCEVAVATTSCPAGTRASRTACVLDADLVLGETLELQSSTTLDCREFRILPTSAGGGTTAATYVPSVPAIGITIVGERDVKVRNCVVGTEDARFDFGIFMADAKNAGQNGHRIRENEIHARDSAVTLLRVDDAQVNDNFITWTNGFGISVRRDSDRNRINSNVMSSPGSPAMPARLTPDGAFWVADDGIALIGFPNHILYNVRIGDKLHQFPNSVDGHYESNDDNVVESNYLSLPGSSTGKSHVAIYVATNEVRARVAGNTVVQAATGIRLAGGALLQTLQRAAQCVTSSGAMLERDCETDADCFIAGIDVAPIGSCPALVTDVIDARARGSVVEGNALFGPFNAPAAAQRAAIAGGAGTVDGVIRGNRIEGTGTEAGITLLGNNMFATGLVSGNVIHGASSGLLLQQNQASSFDARVFLNDIVGSVARAVGVLGAYSLPTELSWNSVGNYWGHEVPPCFAAADSPIPALIEDSNAFCAPVAPAQE